MGSTLSFYFSFSMILFFFLENIITENVPTEPVGRILISGLDRIRLALYKRQ